MPAPRTMPQLLADQASQRPDAIAVLDGEHRMTYGTLAALAWCCGRALQARGVQPGNRIAILDQDSAHLFAAVFGITSIGAIVVPVNWRLAVPEIAFQLDDAEVAWLFTGPELFGKARALAAACPRLAVVALRGHEPGFAELVGFVAGHPPARPAVEVGLEQVAVQMYTSGTTGRPKGVMLAHRSFTAVVAGMQAIGDPWIGWSERDVSLVGIPGFHVGGMWWAMTAFAVGATNVVLPAFAGWRALAAIERHRVTKACMVPAMLQLCLHEPDVAHTDFSSLQTIVYGGSPIPRPLLEAAMRTFRCGFAQIYGLTETGNTAVCLRPADHDRPELLEAAGRPYPGVQVKVVDGQGCEVGTGVVGEICIRSPANMLGYWRRPEATAAVLRGGFVHSGDAGFLDAEGYVHVCDRLKDMVCSAGENVYPAEVESVLCAHPAIAEAAVLGVPDDRWGERVHAVVVLRPGAAATVAEILALARTRLADFKVPRSVEFAASLPRTPSGKLQKHVLREPHWRGRSRGVN